MDSIAPSANNSRPAAAGTPNGSLLSDAETERIRPGSTRPWNPLAGIRYLAGVQEGWHAVGRRAAEEAINRGPGGAPQVAPAECGDLVYVASAYGIYDRLSLAVRGRLCRHCAWTVAIATGSTGRELSLITPDARHAAAIARAGADPMLAVKICQAILAAESARNAEYGLGHPATVQLLTLAARHRPLPLAGEDCAGDPRGCEHRPDDAVGDWLCSYPGAYPACGACSARAGCWAGESEGYYLPECTVRSPCSVLLALADRYVTSRPPPPVP